MGKMIIRMDYNYSGSSNCYLMLINETTSDDILLINDYGEIMLVVDNGRDLARALKNLEEDKYA